MPILDLRELPDKGMALRAGEERLALKRGGFDLGVSLVGLSELFSLRCGTASEGLFGATSLSSSSLL